MSKPSSCTATYKPNDVELFQVTVRGEASYPDALDECRAQAVKGVHELIAAARAEYGEVGVETTD